MDAVLIADDASKTRHSESTLLVRWSAVSALTLAWIVATVLLLRRLSGAAGESPDRVSLWLIAVLMVLLSAGVRWLWRASRDIDAGSYACIAMDWACLPAMVLAGWAVALPGTSAASLAGYAAVVLVAEGWALRGYVRVLRWSGRASSGTSTVAPEPQRASEVGSDEAPDINPDDRIRVDPPQTPTPHFPTADIAQQLTRRVDADGNELVEGWVRAEFAPGQRTASAHVAFCPALEGELSIEFAYADGPEARVKAAQVLPYGVRFDVKLADATEVQDTVLVEFAATGRVVAAEPAS